MDLSKASCHRVAFRRKTIPLGRSWQRFPWSRTGLKIVCTSGEVKSRNATFFFWQTRTRKTAWSKGNSLIKSFSDSFWMRWGTSGKTCDNVQSALCDAWHWNLEWKIEFYMPWQLKSHTSSTNIPQVHNMTGNSVKGDDNQSNTL